MFTQGFGENTVSICRDIVKNNRAVLHVVLELDTEGEKWLPQVLTDHGFFPSNGQVRKNRPDLWRELESGVTTISFPWAFIHVNHS